MTVYPQLIALQRSDLIGDILAIGGYAVVYIMILIPGGRHA
jgi:hypothetical protein